MKLKRLAALLLCAAVMLPLAACAKKPDSGTSRTSQTTDDTTVTPTKDGDTSITATDKDNKGAAAQDLMQGITKGKGASKKPDSRFANVAASFALDLFKDEYKSGKNTLVSPLSVLTALAMTQNGAEGKTLSEMQKVLGGLDRDTLNAYMNAYLAAVAGKDSALKCANSIWVGSKLDVKRAFLQKNADFYSAQAYKADFTSTRTVKEINSWVRLSDLRLAARPSVSVGSVVFIKPGAVYGGCTSARGKRVPDSQLSPKKHTVTKVQQNRGTLEALLGDISSWVAVGSLEEV